MSNFTETFDKYREEGKLKSEQFQYWNKFLKESIPIFRDLTRSHREGNWKIHTSAVLRSLSLFFASDRTNYCHWFLSITTLKCGSGVLIDQKKKNKNITSQLKVREASLVFHAEKRQLLSGIS